MATNETKPEVGQTWQDNVNRGRKFRISAIEGEHAIVDSMTGPKRKTKIRLDRFRINTAKKGYTFVSQSE